MMTYDFRSRCYQHPPNSLVCLRVVPPSPISRFQIHLISDNMDACTYGLTAHAMSLLCFGFVDRHRRDNVLLFPRMWEVQNKLCWESKTNYVGDCVRQRIKAIAQQACGGSNVRRSVAAVIFLIIQRASCNCNRCVRSLRKSLRICKPEVGHTKWHTFI